MKAEHAQSYGYCAVERPDCTHDGGMSIMCDLQAEHDGPHQDRTHDYIVEWTDGR